MVCCCTWNNPLDVRVFVDAVESDDYLKMMTEFLSRVHDRLKTVKAEQDKITVPLPPFTPEQCILDDYRMNIENKVAVIRPERLRPEYRTVYNQLVLATGGPRRPHHHSSKTIMVSGALFN